MGIRAQRGRLFDRGISGAGVDTGSRYATQRLTLTLMLMAGDALAISAAFALAYVVRFKSEWSMFYAHSTAPMDFYSELVFWLVPAILGVFALYQLYALRQVFEGPREYARIGSAATLSLLLVVLLSFLFDDELVISRGWLVISWVLLIVMVSASRFLLRRIVYLLRSSGRLSRRVAVVASGDDLLELARQLQAMPETGLDVVMSIDTRDLDGSHVNGAPALPLRSVIQEQRLDEIIVSSASVPQTVLAYIVRETSQMPTELHLVPGMYEIQTTGVRVHDIRGIPLVTLNKVRITGFDFLMKRSLDYAVGSAVLLALSPILLGVALIIRITSPGPIFHRRQVLGERGRKFNALKFRTMYVDGDRILAEYPDLQETLLRTGKLVDDPRITPIGRWLRRWSIDEFPQLINVLRGQMSLVGPRMITEDELDWFGHWRENLITVKPGLTGLWQVSGRSNLGYDDRVRLDMFYIRSYSIWKDIEILIRTLPAVWRGTGAY